METKKLPSGAKKIDCSVNFEVKASDSGVFIEGFANKNVVDRGDEVVDPKAWALDNFKKNPIILFNHGMDPVLGGTPIGKAVAIEPKDDGLFIKVRISQSTSPLITMIRDLVQEKILKAFSVGFEAKDTDLESGADGKQVRRIKSAELYEVSVVGIPMNQDSIFELSGKMLQSKSLDQIESFVCEKKGAWVAAAAHTGIYANQKDGKDRAELLAELAKEAELSEDELRSILAGDVTPVPENVLAAISTVLGLDLEELQKLNSADAEVTSTEATDDTATDDTATEDTATEEDTTEEMSAEEKDLQQCVRDTIPKLIDEGMSQEQATATAFSKCREGGKCIIPTRAMYKAALDFAAKQAGQEGVDENTTEIAAVGKNDTDFGNPFLDAQKQTNVLLGTLINEMQQLNKKMDNFTGIKEDTPDDNASNVADSMPKVSEENSEEDEKAQGILSDQSKKLDSIEKYLENLNKRIKTLGIK